MEATDNEQDSGLLGFALHSKGEGYENLRLAFQGKVFDKTKIVFYIFYYHYLHFCAQMSTFRWIMKPVTW